MVGKGEDGDIGVQVGVIDVVANILWNKIIRRVLKYGQNTVVHAST